MLFELGSVRHVRPHVGMLTRLLFSAYAGGARVRGGCILTVCELTTVEIGG